MGRICTVLDCPSGRNPDRQRRKRMGVRQVSLFKVPKVNECLSIKFLLIVDINISSILMDINILVPIGTVKCTKIDIRIYDIAE